MKHPAFPRSTLRRRWRPSWDTTGSILVRSSMCSTSWPPRTSMWTSAWWRLRRYVAGGRLSYIWGAGAVHRGEEPGLWGASSGRPPRIGRGAGVVPVPWGYLVAASGGRLLLSGPSAHRQPGDDRHGGRTEEGTSQLAWQADEDTILTWADTEGYPVDGAIGPEG